MSNGSPPRVREPHPVAELLVKRAGITPACAGTTKYGAVSHIYCEDHPRVCGNHKFALRWLSITSGSPPRVREPPIVATLQIEDTRITPACAGTTLASQSDLLSDEDHPRVCGNHEPRSAPGRSATGSPPRVREPLLWVLNCAVAGGSPPRVREPRRCNSKGGE